MPKADGSIIIKADVDDKDAEKRLTQLNKTIEKTEKELSNLQAKKLPIVEQAKELTDALDNAKHKLEYMQSGVEWFPDASIKAQVERVNSLQKSWDRVQDKLDPINDKIKNMTANLDAAKGEAGELEARMVSAGYRTQEAMNAARKSVDKFTNRLKKLAKRVLFFSVFTMALRGARDWFAKIIKTNEEATKSIARLKGALLVLAQPLVEVVLPAFTAVVDVLSDVLYIFATLFSAVQGKTIEETEKAAESLQKEVEAIEGVGSAAKKAEKYLASFDEVNKITESSAASVADKILPDFSGSISNLPAWLKNLVFDLEAKIRDIRFSWDNGEILKNQDAWIVALSGVLGAVIGGMFGGVKGSVIGLLLGVSVGLISCTFLDKTKNDEFAKKLFTIALSSILGAVLGAKFGGITGAVIGLLLGASISLISIEFAKGDASDWDSDNTIIVALSAILGAVLGAAFGGLAGGVIGLLLGGLISFVAIQFSGNDFDKSEAIASLRIALLTLLGLILGNMFGGLFGSVIGVIAGLTIGFASVGFDKTLDEGVRQRAKSAFGVAMTTIIGALVGAVFGGGVFGGIVGGVIGLTLGLAVTFGSATFKNKTGLANSVSSYSSWTGTGTVPKLATGAVIPPNREFLAVLGDQNRGNNIETPEALLRKIVREEGGSHMSDAILRDILDAIRAGHVIAVDNVALGKVMQKTSYNTARASGTSLL